MPEEKAEPAQHRAGKHYHSDGSRIWDGIEHGSIVRIAS